MEQFAAVSTIFDAAEMVIYVADMDTYELLFMNAHAERHWGAGRIGQPCYTVLQSGLSAPCGFCTNRRLIEHGQPTQPVVWEFQNTVNHRWYLCIDKAIPWADGRLVRMEMAIDITERKHSEQFRQQYVGLISHDLRTPLATIAHSAMVLKLLLERHGLPAAAPRVDAILRSTNRMGKMIDDLLETTQLESGQVTLKTSSFDLASLAREVARQLGAAVSRAVTVEPGPAVPVVADAGRIERVLDNLIGNALRYSAADTAVEVRVRAQDGQVVVAVRDHGVGIPALELPRLFQRFYRASSASVEGLGLGLYNSRLIVESHGGRAWAESEPGVGSTFCFSLPCSPDAQPAGL